MALTQEDILQLDEEQEQALTAEERDVADRWEFTVLEARLAVGRRNQAARAAAEQQILAMSDDLLEFCGLTWHGLEGLGNGLFKLLCSLDVRAAQELRFRSVAAAAITKGRNYLARQAAVQAQERWESRRNPFWRADLDQQRAAARRKAAEIQEYLDAKKRTEPNLSTQPAPSKTR